MGRKLVSSAKAEFCLGAAITLYFLFQTSFFAKKIGPEIFPDEPYHIDVAEMWSQNDDFSLPENAATMALGALNYEPYAYHLFLGTLLRVFSPEPQAAIFWLRGVNVGMSLMTFLLGWWFLRLALPSVPGRLTCLAFLATTLMYLFVGGGVSYDNLTNLLAIASFIALVVLCRRPSLVQVLWVISILAAGCLTKISFLPLAFVCALLAAFAVRSEIGRSDFWRYFRTERKAQLLTLVALLLIGLNVRLYGMNIVKFREIVPSCESVFGQEQCVKSNSQTQRYNEYLASAPSRSIMPFNEYLTAYIDAIEGSIFSVVGHRTMPLPPEARQAHRLGLLILCLAFGVTQIWRRGEVFRDRVWLTFLVIAVSYVAVVIGQNYLSYLSLRKFGLGVQGRYLFPVFPLLLYVLVRGGFVGLPRLAQWVLFFVVTFAVSNGGYQYFTTHDSPIWYAKQR